MQAAHEVGMTLHERRERAVGERHHRRRVVVGGAGRVLGHHGIETEMVEIGDQRLEGRRPGAELGSPAFTFPGSRNRRIVGSAVEVGNEIEHHAGKQRRRRRFQPEGGSTDGQGIPMLGPPDLTPGIGGDVEQTDLAHPVEVGAHGVGMEPEGVGDVGRDHGLRGARQLEIDRVSGVVTEHAQDVACGQHGDVLTTGLGPTIHESRLHGPGR